MVVDDFNVPSAVGSPAKADSPLVIDSNAVLATPVTTELLQSVAWRHVGIVQILGAVEHLELPFGLGLERSERPRRTAAEQLLGVALIAALVVPRGGAIDKRFPHFV